MSKNTISFKSKEELDDYIFKYISDNLSLDITYFSRHYSEKGYKFTLLLNKKPISSDEIYLGNNF